ncbi:MAG TPA: exosortase/archaeosortase family protein [Longimicrobiaceae bacterium]|nr:exosortase/archaeosortase family protein [Longimicrobiaceae bacterium]
MTSAALSLGRTYVGDWKRYVPMAATGAAFALLFWSPMMTLGRDWWSDPDAGHGLLLAPVAVYLAWKKGLTADARGQVAAGLLIVFAAVLLRYVSGLAAELFTMRASMMGALFGLVVFYFGFRQLLHWWLPASLLLLSIPLPDVVVGSLALPLQFRASEMGAVLLEWRQVPVMLDGNVLRLPGRSLFVTEACSGLRSLASLISLGLLIGGLWLRHPASRLALIAAAIPVAMALNGIRVFLTGFLVFYVDPKLGEGFMHMTEGWIIFVVAFAILGGIAALLNQAEIQIGRRRA